MGPPLPLKIALQSGMLALGRGATCRADYILWEASMKKLLLVSMFIGVFALSGQAAEKQATVFSDDDLSKYKKYDNTATDNENRRVIRKRWRENDTTRLQEEIRINKKIIDASNQDVDHSTKCEEYQRQLRQYEVLISTDPTDYRTKINYGNLKRAYRWECQ
jgi:hypothetical protein